MHTVNTRNNLEKGGIIVVSAPSGAGKTTLCQVLLKKTPEIAYSISHTTRKPRQGEKDGRDYFFTTIEDFKEKIKQNFWIEWAKVHANYYGTSKKHLEEQILKGLTVLLELDINGARQIKKIYPDALTIFIMAPSICALERRLRDRATEAEDIINMRIDNAKAEIEQKSFFDHIVVNDDMDTACQELCKIVKKKAFEH